MKKVLCSLLLILSSSSLFAAEPQSALAADNIVIKTPEVQVVSTGPSSAEVFMELDNKGTTPIALVAANSPVAVQTQLHTTVHKKGGDTMRQVREIVVKPKGDTELQQGGLHVMLMGLKQSLKQGDAIPVLLVFADGSSMTINATVE